MRERQCPLPSQTISGSSIQSENEKITDQAAIQQFQADQFFGFLGTQENVANKTNSRPEASGLTRTQGSILRLQRIYGNRYVQRLLTLPREADEEPGTMQRPHWKHATIWDSGKNAAHSHSFTNNIVQNRVSADNAPTIAMSTDTETVQTNEEGEQHQIPAVVEDFLQAKFLIQRTSTDTSANADGDLERRLESSKGGGNKLQATLLEFMEPRFGLDFSQVRVHTDGDAVQMNRQLGAQAFAHGRDLYFGEGMYNPSSDSGKWLLAHELTHVVQQTGGVQAKLIVGRPNDAYEREADSVADKVMEMSSISGSEQAVQRRKSSYPSAYLDFLKHKISEPSLSQSDGMAIHAKCTACEVEGEQQVQTRLETSTQHAASPLVMQVAPTSVQRGFFTGDCIAEHWNLAAAITALVAAGSVGIGLILAPDPTTITKWVAIGAIVGVISGIAWTINGIIALISCLQADSDANRREIEDLNRRLRQLEEAQRRIQQIQDNPPPNQAPVE